MCHTLIELPYENGNYDKQNLLISVSYVPHPLPSLDLIQFSSYMWCVPVSNKMNELNSKSLAFFKSRNSMSVTADQTLN